MPKISVIVPVFKVETYLNRCVDSILNQTFTDFELILVDDGSPDACPKICDEYAIMDKRVKVIHQLNQGVSSARNAGLKIAEGVFVTFCDSDDYLESNWLETLYNEIIKSNVDVVNATFKYVDDYKATIQNREREYGKFVFKDNAEKINFIIKKILGGKVGWEVYTRLFKLSIIHKNNICFCETCGNFAEDLGFTLEYMLYCDSTKSIEFYGYCYVQRDESMMHKSASVIKLNSLNEISAQFGNRYLNYITNLENKKYLPVFHFMIMNNQYRKMFYDNVYSDLYKEIEKIKNQKWYFKQTKAIFSCYKQLKNLLGSNYAKRILLFSNYCLHRNWRRFKYESAIAYKLLIRGE